ncbi:MAG: hypothetical protein WCI18_12685 [Pseudomonadota bacterium]
MSKISDKFRKYDVFKKRSYARMTLLLPMMVISCKSLLLDSSHEANTTSVTARPLCAASNPSALMNRLVQFQSHGVTPYLSCPYQSEWSVYPSYYLDDDKNDFRRWIIRVFNELENKSSLANKLLFTDRYEFFTIVMGEGLGELLDSSAGYARVITDGSPIDDPDIAVKIASDTPKKFLQDPRTLEIPGFGVLGTDWFGAEFPKLRQKAFAKPYIGSFVANTHFVNSHQYNERGENVISADFKSLEIGLNAFAAVYLERRQMYLEDSKACLGSVSNDEDTRMFWSYYYFRRPAEGKNKLCSSGGKIPNVRPEEDGEHPKAIPIQCLKRIATKKFLSQEKVLD